MADPELAQNGAVDELVPSMAAYPLSWAAGKDEISIDEFLKAYPPSKQTDKVELPNGTTIQTPWVWVHLPKAVEEGERKDQEAMLEKGKELLDAHTAEIVRIKDDASIPVRASKKNPTSKKVLREQAEADVKQQLQELAVKHACTSGKWLFYIDEERIDGVWTKIAKSLGEDDGALRTKTKTCTAKVSTTPIREDNGKKIYLICVYIPNSFDVEARKQLCLVLIKDLLLSPIGFKADIYTVLGINSDHPSGIKTTIASPNDVMPKSDRDAWFEQHSKKAAVKQKTANEELADGDRGDFEDSSDDEPPAKKAKR